MKEIKAEIYINWDNDGVTVKLSEIGRAHV